MHCFYLTYEEWKPSSLNYKIKKTASFYLTYEEWKLKTLLKDGETLTVFTLPMRNGN